MGDNADAFPTDPNKTKDNKDGVSDQEDNFPLNSYETQDSNSDGIDDIRDNTNKFCKDAKETKDSDGNGIRDNADAFPTVFNRTKHSNKDNQTKDSYPLIATTFTEKECEELIRPALN